MVQSGKAQPWSRAVRARRWAGVKSRILRPVQDFAVGAQECGNDVGVAGHFAQRGGGG